VRDITIKRQVDGPFAVFLIHYKGEYVSAIDPDETKNAYFAAVKLAKEFLADLKAGKVSARYLKLR